jgi:DNA-binding transcriptional ArsR family regulator
MSAVTGCRSLVTRSDDELTATGDLLHALGDPGRLRIVTHLLDRPQTLEELAKKSNLSPFEVRHQLDRFESTGVLVVNGQEPDATYSVRSDLRPVLVQLLAIMESTPVVKPAEQNPEKTPERTSDKTAKPARA